MVSNIPLLLGGIRPGDVVVFRHPRHGKLIKIVDRIEPDIRSVFVIGRNEDSVDSRTFGPVPRRLLMGKVVWHIARDGRAAP